MSRSSDVVSQIHKRRAERKKPKFNAKLKKFTIDENQIGGIAAAHGNKPPPITVQKTGGRNSVALTFSIGLHVAIAILLGFLAIKNQVTSATDELAGLLIAQDLPRTKRNIDVKRDKPTFEAKDVIKTPIQRTPIRNAKIPKRPGGSTLPSALDTNLTSEGPGLIGAPKAAGIGNGLNRPIPINQPVVPPSFNRPTNEGGPIIDIGDIDEPTGGPTLPVPGDIDTSGSEITPPRVKIPRKPKYPENAKRAGKEGTVILQATVGVDGIAKNITALTNLGFGFEEAAIEALKKIRFIPAEKKGEKIERTIKIPFEFKLEED